MKCILLVVSFFILVSCPAVAQEDTSSAKNIEFYFSGGLSYPSLPREFHDYWKKGYNVGVGFGYSFSPGSLGYGGLHGTIEYNQFALDDSGFIKANNLNLTGLTIDGRARKTLTAMIAFKGTFATSRTAIAPYFLIGLGYFKRSAGNITATGGGASVTYNEDAKAAISWSIGAGLDVPLGERLVFFLQGKFILGVTGDAGTQYFPLSAGVRIRP